MEEDRITVAAENKHTGLYVLIGMLLGAALTASILLLVMKNGAFRDAGEETEIASDLQDGTGTALDSVLSEEASEKLLKIRELLEEQFLFDASEADTDTGILKGYVDAFNDPYTVYYSPEEYAELVESTSGTYSGIGVVVTQNVTTGLITVVRPYENCPGAEAGMKTDDIIYKVNGGEVTGIDIDLVVADIKGEAGTTVDITIYRPSTGEYIDMTVERRMIEIETITYEMLEDQIGYIEMSSFDDVTYRQFVEAYTDLENQGMKALILDIRNNGGGLLDSVVSILDYLLPEGTLTYTIDIEGGQETYTSNASAQLDVPFVVLVNGNSASASEILTAAIQDYDAGTIVGTQTFGKGIVQVLYPLGDGSALKLTYARYYTPNGVCIHGEGVTPDVVIEDDASTEEDEQLEEAIGILTSETAD